MLNRRDLLLSAAALSLTPAIGPLAAPAAGESQKLTALFDRFVQEQLQRNPETATGLGLDKSALAPLKSRLTDASLAAAEPAIHLPAYRASLIPAIEQR